MKKTLFLAILIFFTNQVFSQKSDSTEYNYLIVQQKEKTKQKIDNFDSLMLGPDNISDSLTREFTKIDLPYDKKENKTNISKSTASKDTSINYGISTTRWFSQKQLYNDNLKYHHPDTSLKGLHEYKYTYRNNNYNQHQGNLGTAINPVYYRLPEKPGIHYGYNAYDIYGTEPDKVKYYNTKSPYTDVDYLQGINTGQQYLRGEFSRNINRFWNIGTFYQRMSSHKQIGSSQRRDIQTTNQDYFIYTSFQTKDKRYQLLANFKYFLHNVKETGGIKPEFEGQPQSELFDYELENIWLQNAYSRDRRVNYHIYHQYRFFQDTTLSVFHKYNRLYQRTRYNDESINREFYENIYKDSADTFYEGNFREDLHKAGIKGNYKGLHAKLYGKIRKVSFNDKENFIGFNDQYAGGELKYTFKDSIYAQLTGDALLNFTGNRLNDRYNNIFNGKNDYTSHLSLHYKPLTIGYQRILRSPTIFESFLDHNLFKWRNQFGPELADKAYINYKDQFGNHDIQLKLSMKNIYGHIYMDTNATPQQLKDNEDINILSADIGYHTQFNNFHFRGNYHYEKATGPDVIRFPPMIAKAELSYKYHAQKKPRNFFLGGINARWRHGYFGDAYMPATQHFYLQNDFPLGFYTVLNLFISAHIKDTRLFFRWTHLNQGDKGYFITPFYPGMQSSFQFGVHVQLFN